MAHDSICSVLKYMFSVWQIFLVKDNVAVKPFAAEKRGVWGCWWWKRNRIFLC